MVLQAYKGPVGPVSRMALLLTAAMLYSHGAAAKAPVENEAGTDWYHPGEEPAPVSVVINGETAAEPCLAVLRAGRLFVASTAPRMWGLHIPPGMGALSINGEDFTPLDGVAGLSAHLDEGGENLLIDADPQLFPEVHLGSARRGPPVGRAVPAQFIGYDLSLAKWYGKLSASAFLDAGLSGSWGVFGTTAMVQSEGRGFTRLDSSFQRDFPDQRLRLVLGDTLTRGGDWNRPIRFGGIRLGTDFSLTPNDITYPLPVVRGSAALPSVVELAAASSRQKLDVQPGNFSIDYQPVFTGTGEVTMTIRDAAGNMRNVTRSFYTSPRLLREGLDDFSLEAGFLRQNFGWQSFSYGSAFAAAAWHHGLTGALTLSGRAEGSGNSQAAGLGIGLVIAPLGEFSVTAAASRSKWGSGNLWRAQFQRITPLYAITASYQEESADFTQVGDDRTASGKRSELTVAGSITLGRMGNLSASHVENDEGSKERFAASSLSYAANLGPAYLSLGARRTRLSGGSDDGVFGSVTFPFGQRTNASLFSDRNRTAATVSRSPAFDRGLGYRVLMARDHDNGTNIIEGGLRLRSAAGELELSAARNGPFSGLRLQASGALLMAGGEVIAAPRLDYAFALVDVLGDQEAALTFENRPLARRAGNGKRAIVTGLQPYAANRIGVDLDALPIDTLVTSPEQLAVPGYRQVVKITFGSAPVRPATLQLVDGNGVPLPLGLAVSGADGSPGVTGQDGEIYLPDAHPGERIIVRGGGITCQTIVPALPQDVAAPRVGLVPCVALEGDEQK